jgi:tetratricopeptide (TPR) repeat protein
MQWNNAKKYYERAIRADKTHAFAVNNLGMVHYHKKKWKNAAKEFHRALELRADLPAVESNLGHAYFMMKKYDQAFSAFGRALALDPQVFERRSGNAGSLLQDRSVEDRAQYYFFLARTFASINDVERCAQYLLKARDENYRGLLAIEKDPMFATVVKDERIQQFLLQTRTLAQTQTRKE